MAEEVAGITTWLRLLTYGTGTIIALKQFGNRLPYRWEIFDEDRSSWVGTLYLGVDEILQLAQLTRPEKINFVANALVQAFGTNDDRLGA